MKRVHLVILLLFFLLITVTPSFASPKRGIAVRPVSPSGSEVAGDQWLFVVGINTYIHWPRLATAVNDARSVKNVLVSRYHFEKKHLIELYDERATRRNILGKLRFLAGKIKKQDSLVIFYAGHGHLDSITKEGSWVPVESGTDDASAWITNHDIKNYLNVDAIKAKHILLISDSCFSGDFFRGQRGKLPTVTDSVIKKAYRLSSRQAITSGGIEPVSDAGFGNNSVFSYFLIKTLSENQKPFLIPSDFFSDIRAGVAQNAEQFPQLGALRGTGGQQGGEFVFFLRRESRLKSLSAAASEKEATLAKLRTLEKEEQAAQKKEALEIANRKKELTKLDSEIAQMRKRMGTSPALEDDSLDAMLAMVRKREKQQKRLEKLNQQRVIEEKKRKAEIEKLKKENAAKKVADIQAVLNKYKQIVASPFGKDMQESAWNSIIDLYPEAKGVHTDDIRGFKEKVGLLPENITNGLGMEFVYIEPWTFMMGSPSSELGRDSNENWHQVTLTKGYYMQTTEVTQGQWRAVMGSNPSEFKNCGDDCPVENVSWDDVQAFTQELNMKERKNRYRLPTEAEWEYAARAGSTTAFVNGGISDLKSMHDSNLDAMGWYFATSDVTYSGCEDMRKGSGPKCAGTHPVAKKQPNAWGLYDMHGNVGEWCQDWYKKTVLSDPVTDPTGPSSGSQRVVRGGAWQTTAKNCRSASRTGCTPVIPYSFQGFRLALSPGQ